MVLLIITHFNTGSPSSEKKNFNKTVTVIVNILVHTNTVSLSV